MWNLVQKYIWQKNLDSVGVNRAKTSKMAAI